MKTLRLAILSTLPVTALMWACDAQSAAPSEPEAVGVLAARASQGNANQGNAGIVTICHIPPGNAQNEHTIAVSANVGAAHVAHGDGNGPCEDLVCPGLSCTDLGFIECSAACVDVNTDEANCGACGSACNQGEVCQTGICTLSCAGGTTACGGVCADVNTDEANCGACGSACNQGEVCQTGICSLSCAGGTAACGGVCADLSTDEANCGACNNTCAQGLVCQAGTCI